MGNRSNTISTVCCLFIFRVTLRVMFGSVNRLHHPIRFKYIGQPRNQVDQLSPPSTTTLTFTHSPTSSHLVYHVWCVMLSGMLDARRLGL